MAARVLALLAMFTLAGCSKKEAGKPEPVVPVQVARVERGSIRHVIEASGVLYPRDQASITPKISAPVKSFLVNRGDRVAAGQLIAMLENRDLVAAVRDAKGQLDQAESNLRALTQASLPEEAAKSQHDVDAAKEALDAAQKVMSSREQLFHDGAIARRQVDEAGVALAQARSQYENAAKHLQTLQGAGRQEQVKGAEAQVESARGRYESAQAQVAYSEVRSPIAGMVAERPLYPGDLASPGSPLLTIVDTSRVVARLNVPSRDALSIHVGNTAKINTPDGGVDGKVTVVSPAADAQTTTIEIWVEAANPGGALKPGAAVQAEIFAATIADALIVPASAVLSAQDAGNEALVVGTDSVAHERRLSLGAREGNKVQVLGGLKEGENVVIVGGVGVQDGARVRVVGGANE